tara:strand:- start:139 stop:288 length:150 start_codon:yes stop_codon:yes gene_type:complete
MISRVGCNLEVKLWERILKSNCGEEKVVDSYFHIIQLTPELRVTYRFDV